MKNFYVVVFLLSSYTIFSSSFAAGDAGLGKAKTVTCIACHGKDGNSLAAGFPKIAGQNENYLYKQLKDFKSGTRKDVIMFGMVAALSDDDMRNVAAYYANQTSTPNTAKVTPEQLALGKQIYRGGKASSQITACIACHGPTGAGIPSAGFPKISSQHAAYTAKQLRDFRQVSFNNQTNGDIHQRSNDYGKMMQNVATSLTDDEIEALAQYISGLH